MLSATIKAVLICTSILLFTTSSFAEKPAVVKFEFSEPAQSEFKFSFKNNNILINNKPIIVLDPAYIRNDKIYVSQVFEDQDQRYLLISFAYPDQYSKVLYFQNNMFVQTGQTWLVDLTNLIVGQIDTIARFNFDAIKIAQGKVFGAGLAEEISKVFEQTPFELFNTNSELNSYAKKNSLRFKGKGLKFPYEVNLPVNNEKVAIQDNGLPEVESQLFSYKERQYEVRVYYYKTSVGKKKKTSETENLLEDSENEIKGETYLIRDDLKYIRVSYSGVILKEGYSEVLLSPEGILSFGDDPRRIDLDHFDDETLFQAKLTHQSPQTIAALFNERHYLNLSQEAKNKTNWAFEKVDQKKIDLMKLYFHKQALRSMVLVGETGSGKKELKKHFINLLANGHIGPRTWEVYKVDAIRLNSGNENVGMFEKAIESLINFAKVTPVIYDFGDMVSMRGTGSHSGSSNDAFQFIKEPISTGEMTIMGTADGLAFLSQIKGDPELQKALNIIQVDDDLAPEVLKEYIMAWVKMRGLSKNFLTEKVYQHVLAMAEYYSSTGAQLGRVTDFLDLILAHKKNQNTLSKPMTVAEVDGVLNTVKAKQVSHLDNANEMRQLLLHDIPEALARDVVGQAHPKSMILQSLKRSYVGIANHKRPKLFLLNVGPSGVGKTELANSLAKTLKVELLRNDMNNYREGQVNELLKKIAATLDKDPRAVILLDEFEKAPSDIQNAILAIGDEGTFNVSYNVNASSGSALRTIKANAREAHFILTGNAGWEWIVKKFSKANVAKIGFVAEALTTDAESQFNAQQLSLADRKELINKLVEFGISRPVLDRVDLTYSLPPTEAEFAEVLKIHTLKALDDLYRNPKRQVKFNISNESLTQFCLKLAHDNFRHDLSNREALLLVTEVVRNTIADLVLHGSIQKGAVFEIYDCESFFKQKNQ